MHAKKWSEFSGHGKITSSDSINYSREEGFEPYRKEGTGYPSLPEHGYYAKELRKSRAKAIVIGFCIHSVIFYVSYLLGFYDGLCIAQTGQAVDAWNILDPAFVKLLSFQHTAFPSGIIIPFWSCGDGLTLANIFGSFHLILLPLFIYLRAIQKLALRFESWDTDMVTTRIVLGFCIHSVIFYIGFFAGFYEELCLAQPGILIPFCSNVTGDIFHFDSLFGSFYLILPLLIYFALFGKKAAVVVIPIVTAAMLFGSFILYQQIDLGWTWWTWSGYPDWWVNPSM